MGLEHEAETVWRAMELYCSERLSFDAVARQTGVAASTLKRWSEKYQWRAKREELARAEADIRADKVLARSKMVKALIDKPSANLAFGVAALEAQALKEAEAARQGAALAVSEEAASVSIKTPAEAAAALKKAVEARLAYILTRQDVDILHETQKVSKTLQLIGQLEAAQAAAAPEGANGSGGGITADFAARIEAAMRGEL